MDQSGGTDWESENNDGDGGSRDDHEASGVSSTYREVSDTSGELSGVDSTHDEIGGTSHELSEEGIYTSSALGEVGRTSPDRYPDRARIRPICALDDPSGGFGVLTFTDRCADQNTWTSKLLTCLDAVS